MLRRCSKHLQTLYRRQGQTLRLGSTEVPKVFGALSQAAARQNRVLVANNQIASIHFTNPLFEVQDVMTPNFPDSVSEGDVKLDKKVGDAVAADEVMCEIETDKTAIPVMAPAHGIIKEIYVSDGATVKAGQKLFKLELTGEAPKKAAEAPAPEAPKAAAPPPPPPTPQAPPQAPPSAPSSTQVQDVMTPNFPDSVSEGDVKLDKKVGDAVAADEVMCQIETDKTAIPVMAPAHGIIKEIYVSDGATVKAGQKLFKLELTGEAPKKAAEAPAPEAPKAAIPPPPPPSASAPPPPPPTPQAPPRAPPSAPISSIPVAAIRHAQAIETSTVKVPPADYSKEIAGTRTEQRVKMNRMRLRIAQRLKDAQDTNAMLTTFNEIDMSHIMAFRKKHLEKFTKKHGVKLGLMSPFVKAAASALIDQPVCNAVIDGTDVLYRDYVDISVAVATPKGLVVPVIRNVQTMTYADIELTVAGLAEKARQGKLTIEEMDGGTFTISNGGVFGSLLGTPIINPPQSAILGMHGIFERPIALNGQVVIRPMMYIALTYDHRLIDGREAVLFLKKIKEGVEDPATIIAGL